MMTKDNNIYPGSPRLNAILTHLLQGIETPEIQESDLETNLNA